jgi:hypothetical protein
MPNKLPKYLYKYVDIDTAIKIIESSSILFQSPNVFNDPFDCQLDIDFNNSVHEYVEYFKLLSEDKGSEASTINMIIDSSPSELKQEIKENLFRKAAEYFVDKPSVMQDNVNQYIEKIKESTGITCFSEDCTNILMWSHYGDKHCGVCLRFEPNRDDRFFEHVVKVEYENVYPQYSFIRQRNEFRQHLIGTKFKDWEYEKERRVLKLNKGLYNFSKKSLTQIIFGLRTSDKNIKDIKRIIKTKLDNKVAFAEACLGKNEFKINIKEVNNDPAS